MPGFQVTATQETVVNGCLSKCDGEIFRKIKRLVFRGYFVGSILSSMAT